MGQTMKISRLFRRRKYNSHRRKIDLFATGTSQRNDVSQLRPEAQASLKAEFETVDIAERPSEAGSVKDAFDAFKKSIDKR